MSVTEYGVYVDWTGDGDFSDPEEDITGDVLGFETVRGRDYASQLTGRSNAGACRISLDNTSGKYNSFNSSSAIYGNILPGRKVQIQNQGSFPYTFPFVFAGTVLWTGYLERVEPSIDRERRKTATLYAVGSLAMVAQKKIRVAMQTSRRTDQAIGDVLDDVGWAAGDRELQTGKTTMARWWADDVLALNAMRDIEATEFGFLWEKADGKIAFADRHYRSTNSRCNTSQATLRDTVATALGYNEIQQQDPLREIYNVVEASVQRYTVGSLAVLWTLSESGANSPKIEAGQTRTWWASYPNPDSVTNGVGVDAWTTPVENTDYEANTAADGSGTDKSSVLTVTVSKFARAMKIQIENTDTVDVYLTLLQARGTPVTADDPVRVVAEDSASQTKYQKRTFPIASPYIPTTDEAVDYTNLVVGIYATPIPVLRIGIEANRSAEAMAEVFVRELNDRVTIVATGNSGLGINEDFWVEAIRHSVDRQRHHWTEYDLSPVADFGGFWTLNVSRQDSEMLVAY